VERKEQVSGSIFYTDSLLMHAIAGSWDIRCSAAAAAAAAAAAVTRKETARFLIWNLIAAWSVARPQSLIALRPDSPQASAEGDAPIAAAPCSADQSTSGSTRSIGVFGLRIERLLRLSRIPIQQRRSLTHHQPLRVRVKMHPMLVHALSRSLPSSFPRSAPPLAPQVNLKARHFVSRLPRGADQSSMLALPRVLWRAYAVRAVAREAKLDLVCARIPPSAFFSTWCSASPSPTPSSSRRHRLQVDTLASVKKFTASAAAVASSLHSSHASANKLLASVRFPGRRHSAFVCFH
jgi:hypothetical protein